MKGDDREEEKGKNRERREGDREGEKIEEWSQSAGEGERWQLSGLAALDCSEERAVSCLAVWVISKLDLQQHGWPCLLPSEPRARNSSVTIVPFDEVRECGPRPKVS